MEFNRKFTKNTKGRDFFVGDIHGEYDMFVDKLAEINFDFTTDRMFSVGDLIDRGPKSLASLALLTKPWFFAVRGNHEDFLLGAHAYHIWMMNGGTWSNAHSEETLEGFRTLVDNNMSITMEVETEYGTIGVVHAESETDWEHNSPLSKETNLWARHKVKYGRDITIKNIDRVVSGHTPVSEVLRYTNVVQIDTGAVFDGGFLTILTTEEVFNL
jgi:serine/threonine protein phosphatase 1